VIEDRTNHNALAAQMYQRFREQEIEAFEARARGDVPHRWKNPALRRPPTSQQPNEELPAMSNMLFQPASHTTAYLKAGFMGKPGSGKTLTASLLALGLVQHMREIGAPNADKPVFFYDTETGSNFVIKHFNALGVPMMQAKTRLFADLVKAVEVAETEASVLIIDSITHPWQELQESYLKKKQRSFLQIDDWSFLKGPQGWKRFSDAFINSKLHIVMAGRVSDETEQYVDDNGKRQFEKVGTKMKTETDTGYEPSLLTLMERDEDLRTHDVTHCAKIMKDRTMLLDGKEFAFSGHGDDGHELPSKMLVKQVWNAFAPHIQELNLGGRHLGITQGGDSTHIIKTEKRDWQPVQRKIVLDEIKDLLTMHVPGQAAADKQRRVVLMREHFSAGWVEIEETFDLLTLRAGFDSLHRELEGKPSRYASAMEAEVVPPLADDIPDHSKAPSTPQVAAAAA
jgi:hypothetical protein